MRERALRSGVIPTSISLGNREYSVAILVCLTFLCTAIAAAAPAGAPESAHPDIHRLIHDMAYNEIQARERPAHLYKLKQREWTPQSAQTSLEIETRRGNVSRLIRLNGHPPAEKQCQKNLSLLRRILSDPALQQSRLRTQRTEMRRRASLFVAMPRAFVFHFEGIEKDTGWVRLKYSPNPQFHPATRTAAVLQGLAGTMWIDPKAQRLVRINGRLVRSVTFGWGFLAKLYPGGHFEMEQSKVAGGNWHQTSLAVSLRGTELIFKKLRVNLKETFASFQPVPNNITLAEAVHELERAPVQCAKQ
ncbi:MAG: hypothetical protein ACRD1N_10770 [Terriglobia bacterium]